MRTLIREYDGRDLNIMNAWHEEQIAALKAVVKRLQDEIRQRDALIEDLRRDVHELSTAG